MSRTLYPPGKNPAVALYDLWYTLLSAQGDLTRPGRERFPQQTDNMASEGYPQMAWGQVMPRIGYGDKITGIGVSGWDDQNRPILVFGAWYRRNYGIYGYMEVKANGEFRVFHPHGDNHNRIERNTFLGYGYRGNQYVWYVSLNHGPDQKIDTRDFRTRKPWVYERALRQDQVYWRTNNKAWVVLEDKDGEWMFRSVEPDSDHDKALIHDYTRAERLYRKAENYYYHVRGERPPRLSVRAGKTVLKEQDAVRQIAALLDVNAPAKVTRHEITEEVMA